MADSSHRRVVLVSELTRVEPTPLRELELAGFTIHQAQGFARESNVEALAGALQGAWASVAGVERYSHDLFARVPTLRVIARTGIGIDSIDVTAATDAGIAVVVSVDSNTESVADFTLALMLASVRQLHVADAHVRSGHWRSGELSGDLFGSTVGLVGLGKVGRAVARRLRSFNCQVLVSDPVAEPDVADRLGVQLVQLRELLRRVDLISIHVPLLPGTRHLIDSDELALLKRGAILVNTSRGGIINENALVDALRSGSVGAAALDVFEHEPLPPDHPLLSFPNVIATGHVAAFSKVAARNTISSVVRSLLDVAAGKIPSGCVNPSVLREGRP